MPASGESCQVTRSSSSLLCSTVTAPGGSGWNRGSPISRVEPAGTVSPSEDQTT